MQAVDTLEPELSLDRHTGPWRPVWSAWPVGSPAVRAKWLRTEATPRIRGRPRFSRRGMPRNIARQVADRLAEQLTCR